MLTTVDALKNSSPSVEAFTTDLHSFEGDVTDEKGVIGSIAGGLFLLDVLIVCLALGQLLIWCTTVVSVEPQALMLSVSDAIFSTALIIHRLPLPAA